MNAPKRRKAPELPFRIPFGWELARNFIEDAVRIRLQDPPRLRPLILAYFVTFRCNLRCSYCDYSRNDFAAIHPDLDTRAAREVLKICREGVPSIGFSGGEPLVRDDIVELVRCARDLGYRPISLFTNSLLLPEREEILDHVDFLQISLDTLNEERQDQFAGTPGVGARTRANIVRYARQQGSRGFRINVNCVVGPHNISDVPALLDFCVENGVRFSIVPELDDWGMPTPELTRGQTYERYRGMMEDLIRHKRAGNSLVDIRPFIEHLAEFRTVRCYPALAPRVYADGSFVYPCPNRCREPQDVRAAGSWEELVATVSRGNASHRDCTTPCFLPYYVETSLLVRHPFALLRELGG